MFNSAQSTIFDAENNRVKIHRQNKIFREVDNEVQVYNFDIMRLLVSDPSKQMCMKLDLADLSPFTAKQDPAVQGSNRTKSKLKPLINKVQQK